MFQRLAVCGHVEPLTNNVQALMHQIQISDEKFQFQNVGLWRKTGFLSAKPLNFARSNVKALS